MASGAKYAGMLSLIKFLSGESTGFLTSLQCDVLIIEIIY